jgi:hypothetical protein
MGLRLQAACPEVYDLMSTQVVTFVARASTGPPSCMQLTGIRHCSAELLCMQLYPTRLIHL